MERFAKVVNRYKPLTIFPRSSILHVWLGSEYVSASQYLTITCFTLNYVVAERLWGEREWMCNIKLLHTNATPPTGIWTSKCLMGYIKTNVIQYRKISMPCLFINVSHFKSNNFFKILCYDYSKFVFKITICCLGNIRIQLKKIKKDETLKNFATILLVQRFWACYRSLLPIQFKI